MKSYHELQLEVFNWLMNKHQADNNFNFSVRQKANRGAETNYFIGTEKSKYFSTTFWFIRVNFPGSASDLINLVFQVYNEHHSYHIQFNQTRSPFDEQNTLALEFIVKLKEKLRGFRGFVENDSNNKMEYFQIGNSKKNYTEETELFDDVSKDLDLLIPIIDNELDNFKTNNPQFIGDKISSNLFDELIQGLNKRMEKHSGNKEHSWTIPLFEENVLMKTEITHPEIKLPLNQILYGPPGTGKTFKLQKEFVEKFVVTNKTKTKEEFISETIKSLSLWQVLTLILLEGEANVPTIMNHKYIQFKLSVSKSNSFGQNIWAALQMHAVEESQTVSYTNRTKPLFMNKREDAVWYIEESKKDLIGDIVGLYEKIRTYKDVFVSENNWRFCTFHQSMSYEDFIEGIKPTLSSDESNEDVRYHIEKGIFYECCDKAARLAGFLSLKDAIDNYSKEERKDRFAQAKGYALFVDEINRGNIAAIFGELITLIEDDKRLGENEIIVTLPYSKEKFGVPPNLYIIGTMNTADRSVEALDAALRRRFSFTEMTPQPDLIRTKGKAPEGKIGEIDLIEVLTVINKRIEILLDKDHQIGHSYFLSVATEDDLKFAFKNKIIPLLQEYFFGDYGKIGLVLGSGFVDSKPKENNVFAKFSNKYDASDLADRDVYYFKNIDGIDIQDAIKTLLNN